MRKVEVIPVVIGVLVIGTITKDHDKWIEKIGILIKAEYIQTTALLGTERILTKVLET